MNSNQSEICILISNFISFVAETHPCKYAQYSTKKKAIKIIIENHNDSGQSFSRTLLSSQRSIDYTTVFFWVPSEIMSFHELHVKCTTFFELIYELMAGNRNGCDCVASRRKQRLQSIDGHRTEWIKIYCQIEHTKIQCLAPTNYVYCAHTHTHTQTDTGSRPKSKKIWAINLQTKKYRRNQNDLFIHLLRENGTPFAL